MLELFILSSSLISAILSLLLGYVFINKSNRNNFPIHFFNLTLCVFFIGIAQFFFLVVPHSNFQTIFQNIASFFLFLFPALFVHFIVKVTDNKDYSRNRFSYLCFYYFPAVLFTTWPLLDRILFPNKVYMLWKVQAFSLLVPSYFIKAFLIYVIAHLFYCVFFVLHYRRKNITSDLRKKTDIILLGVIVAFVFGLIPEIFYQIEGIAYLQFGIVAFFISLAVISITLHTFRYHVHVPDAFFKAIMEIMSDVLLVLDFKGRIIYSSQSTSAMLGYSVDELYQMELKALFRDKDKPLFYKDNKPVFPYDRIVEFGRKEAIKNYDIELEGRQGEIIPLDVIISPFIEDEFGRKYLMMLGRDLREVMSLIREINSYKTDLEDKVRERTKALEEANKMLKETQANLIQTEKMNAMGLLAGGVAHEVNTPLSGVLGYVELLIHKLEKGQLRDDWEFILEKLRIVRECGFKCKAISEKFLEFSRKSGIKFEKVDIHSVIEDALLVTHNAIKYEMVIEKHYAENLPFIIGNSNELQQVLVNLIINARDAKSEKGLISITTSLSEDDVVIVFSDNGEGIDEENLEKIFKPFFTTKEPGKGTGLGLSVSAGIIKKHKGKFEVQSEKGKGTTFTISLPNSEKSSKLFKKEDLK